MRLRRFAVVFFMPMRGGRFDDVLPGVMACAGSFGRLLSMMMKRQSSFGRVLRAMAPRDRDFGCLFLGALRAVDAGRSHGLVRHLIEVSGRGRSRLKILRVSRRRLLQVVEVIAHSVVGKNVRRHHLGVHLRGAIAQIEFIHPVDAERIRKRQRTESFLDNGPLVSASRQERSGGQADDNGGAHNSCDFSLRLKKAQVAFVGSFRIRGQLYLPRAETEGFALRKINFASISAAGGRHAKK